MGGKQHKKHKTAKPPNRTPNPIQTGVSTEPTQETHREVPASSAVEYHNENPKGIAAWKYRPLRDSGVTIATLVMTSVIATIYFFQLLAMRQTVANIQDNFNAANRPFVGVNGIGVVDTATKDAPGNLIFRVEVKNFGPVSADNYRGESRVWLNGQEVSGGLTVREGPITLFPGKALTRNAIAGTSNYEAIKSGRLKVVLEIKVDYDGPSKHYTYCERFEYNPAIVGFSNLGAGCS